MGRSTEKKTKKGRIGMARKNKKKVRAKIMGKRRGGGRRGVKKTGERRRGQGGCPRRGEEETINCTSSPKPIVNFRKERQKGGGVSNPGLRQ